VSILETGGEPLKKYLKLTGQTEAELRAKVKDDAARLEALAASNGGELPTLKGVDPEQKDKFTQGLAVDFPDPDPK
jgi:hypothetical protein